MIQSEGFRGALINLAANIEEVLHIHCSVDCEDNVDVRDPTTALHLYRIAQEAVSNAARHGNAKAVGILLRQVEDRISMLIRDDGCGIPQPLPPSIGIGLRTMRYRAENIGATLEIRPGTRQGTEVVCSLPARLAQRAGHVASLHDP